MDFRWTPDQQEFRQEIRAFLDQELPREARSPVAEEGRSPEFSRKLGQKGWIGLAWPKEYGGRGLGYLDRLIYAEEMVLSGAPIGYHHVAERQMGPSLIQFGSHEQKRFFLPLIARGECSFAIGYSEPDGGSDLASLKTIAVQDGDDFVVTGTKLWNNAHKCDYLWLAARTNPHVPKHKGLSVFIVDLAGRAPGLEIRPLPNMLGEPGFCEVVFNGFRLPKTALVGERDQGWYIIAGNLDFERAGIERVGRFYPLWKEFLAFLRGSAPGPRPLTVDPLIRHQVAERQIEFEAGRLIAYKVADELDKGRIPNREASISKLFGTETAQRMARTMLEALGLYGQLAPGSPYAPLAGRVERAWLYAFSLTIAAGTSEILRNVIALRGLGLPRG